MKGHKGYYMKTVDYSKYYWQNDFVRFREKKAEDWEECYFDCFDSEALFLLECDMELPTTKAHYQEFFSTQQNDSKNIGFVIETLSGEVIGGIGLDDINERNGNFSISMRINHDFRGKGYGTSALKLLLDYAFNERRLHKFNATLVDGNIASESMLKKLGCVKEGLRRDAFYHKGKYWNEFRYGLIDSEFNSILNK